MSGKVYVLLRTEGLGPNVQVSVYLSKGDAMQAARESLPPKYAEPGQILRWGLDDQLVHHESAADERGTVLFAIFERRVSGEPFVHLVKTCEHTGHPPYETHVDGVYRSPTDAETRARRLREQYDGGQFLDVSVVTRVLK